MYHLFLLLLLLFLYKSDDAKGIPEFWLTAMKNVDMLADMIQVCVVLVVQPFYPQVWSASYFLLSVSLHWQADGW